MMAVCYGRLTFWGGHLVCSVTKPENKNNNPERAYLVTKCAFYQIEPFKYWSCWVMGHNWFCNHSLDFYAFVCAFLSCCSAVAIENTFLSLRSPWRPNLFIIMSSLGNKQDFYHVVWILRVMRVVEPCHKSVLIYYYIILSIINEVMKPVGKYQNVSSKGKPGK